MNINSDNVHFRPVEMKIYENKINATWCITNPMFFFAFFSPSEEKSKYVSYPTECTQFWVPKRTLNY